MTNQLGPIPRGCKELMQQLQANIAAGHKLQHKAAMFEVTAN